MKKILFIMFVYSFVSCDNFFGISDYSSPATDIAEAKNNNLLINTYQPSIDKIHIGNEEYLIIEAWTSYRFKTKNEKKINKSFYDFQVKLKNTTLNKNGLSFKVISNYRKYLKFYDNNGDLTNGLITNDNINLINEEKEEKNKFDKITIGFTDYKNEEVFVIFKKIND